MPSGIIIKGIGGFYYVKTENGIYECKARGVFRKDSKIPLPGDEVVISVIDEEKKKGYIEEICERKNTVDKTGGGKYKPDSFGCFGEITVAGFCSFG